MTDARSAFPRAVASPVALAAILVTGLLAAALAVPFGWIGGVLGAGIGAAGLLAALFAWPVLGGPAAATEGEVTTEDIRLLIREGERQGVLEPAERALVESVLKFSDVEVRRVMAPRPNVVGISIAWAPDEILRYAVENKFSRYPVYDDGMNDIVGFLYYKDLLPVLYEKRALDLRALMRPPFFVPETMRLGTLLKEMQRRRTELAVVVNEHGNVEGVVTLEDLLEEIVGEIRDEYDVEERRVERLRDGSWLVDASLLVAELPPELRGLVPAEDGYETVAGFALATLQRLPRSGETWDVRGWRLTVVELAGRRISRIKIQRL